MSVQNSYGHFFAYQWSNTSYQFHFTYWSQQAFNWVICDILYTLKSFLFYTKKKKRKWQLGKSSWTDPEEQLFWCSCMLLYNSAGQLLFKWFPAACTFHISTSYFDSSQSQFLFESITQIDQGDSYLGHVFIVIYFSRTNKNM